MENATNKMILAAKRNLAFSVPNSRKLLGLIVLLQWAPLGFIKLSNFELPLIILYLQYPVLYVLRGCVYCYIFDMLTGKKEKSFWRCLTWPKLYEEAIGIAIVHRRLIVPLIQLITLPLLSAQSKEVNGILLLVLSFFSLFFMYSSFFLTSFFSDSFLIELIISEGKMKHREMIKGWMPMLASRLKLEMRLAKMAVLPILTTCLIIFLLYTKVDFFWIELIMFCGVHLLWGVGLRYAPLNMVTRFMHTYVKYHSELL